MENRGIAPPSGAVDLTPREARKYFEFFRRGTRREVLLLADLVEQPVHYVRSKGHKVLCVSRVGPCELCERSAVSDDVETRQTEYYAPSFVRAWSDREFHQRVSVFSAACGEQVLRISPEGSARGNRIDVNSIARGTSTRHQVKALEGLPRGFPAVIPAGFDLLPFIRARHGLMQDPARPLVFLPSFACENGSSSPVGRPRPLDLTASDRPNPEELAKIKAILAQQLAKPAEVEQPEPDQAEQLGELAVTARAHDPAAYGPRQRVTGPAVAGASLVGDVLNRISAAHPARNGQHANGRKGGGA